jgi:hypothetical protein
MLIGWTAWALLAQGAEDPAAIVESVVKAAGGKEKLLTTFRLKERLAVSADPEAKGSERATVLQPPGHWYLGKKNRVTEDKEPAVMLAWAWTLRVFLDPASKLEALPPADGRVGLRIKGSIEPPMDVWFDAKERRLAAIDWRKDRHVFSEWKELDGLRYPSRVVGHKPDGKVWYHTRILELTRLEDLPADLKK